MLRKKQGQIEWLESELFQPFPQVKHALFLRSGDFGLGDKEQSTANQDRALGLLGLEKGVRSKQVHGDEIGVVKQGKKGWIVEEGFDALLTQEKGVGLLIRHADCQAAIFYDPVHEAIANVHSGWRGSVKNIYKKTVEKMKQCYGTTPSELRVCISPSLGPQWAQFRHFPSELPPSFWKYQVRPAYFDFWAISRSQLLALGIRESHIEIASICTYQNEEICFSYRRDKKTKLHGTLVGLSYHSW